MHGHEAASPRGVRPVRSAAATGGSRPLRLGTRLGLLLAVVTVVAVLLEGAVIEVHARRATEDDFLIEARRLGQFALAAWREQHRQRLASGLPLDAPEPLLSGHSPLHEAVEADVRFSDVHHASALDAAERAAVDAFRAQPGLVEWLAADAPDPGAWFQWITPLRMEAACLHCHGAREQAPAWMRERRDLAAEFGHAPGEVRAVFSVRKNRALFESLVREHHRDLWRDQGLVLMLLAALILFLLRGVLLARLEALTAVVARQGAGERHLRSGERPLDELGALGEALDRFADRLQASEERAREQAERYRQIIEHLGDGAYVVSAGGGILEFNHRACELTRATPEEMALQRVTGQAWGARIDIRGEDGRPLAVDDYPAVRALCEGQPQLGRVISLGFGPGDVTWLLVHAAPLFHAGETVPYAAIVTLGDITALQAARRKLQASEQHLRQVLASVTDGVFTMDPEGRATLVNAAALRLLGYGQVEELTGRVIHDLIHHSRPDGTPLSLADCRACDVQRTGKGVTVDSEVYWRRDGRPIPVEYRAEPIVHEARVTGVVVSFNDISARLAADEQARRAAAVFESASDAILLTDPAGVILSVNPAFERITGYPRAQAVGHNARLLRSGRHARDFYQAMWRALLTDGRWSGEIWNRCRDGQARPALLSLSAVRGEGGVLLNYVGVLTDLSRLKESESRLDHLAHFDPLTGLANRLLLGARLHDAVERARRAGRRMAVLHVDLDRFKQVNDSYGDAAGDALLREVAARLTALLRRTDLVARLGGDEFVCLLEEVGEEQDASRIAGKIVHTLSQVYRVEQHEVYLGANVGISLFPEHGADGPTLLHNAESAMQAARREGRGAHRYFAQEHNGAARQHMEIEAGLHQALEQGQLELHLQPIVSVRDGVAGLEALVRWRHPEQGLLFPGRFLPVAEDTGLIAELDAWVLDSACRLLGRIHAAGHPGLYVAVNLSGYSFGRGAADTMVCGALAGTGLPAHCLEIEISEGMLRDQADRALASFSRLREQGVRLAIDDFGTGYASFGMLKDLPVQVLKIDQSFVRRLEGSAREQAIVRTIIALGRNLGLDTVAEGVETEAQLQFLEAEGCDRLQGFLFARGLPEAELLAWLAARPPAAPTALH